MLVVADSSPLHYLVEIGCVQVLPTLFNRVVIPPQVADELSHRRAPERVREFIAQLPTWLEIQAPQSLEEIPGLDLGERAAISLAQELNSDFLLIDERVGRQQAVARKLVAIGTLGVLERAAEQELLDLKSAIDSLRRTTFHVSELLLDEVLRRHRTCD